LEITENFQRASETQIKLSFSEMAVPPKNEGENANPSGLLLSCRC
jgi:hypothetical protein